MYICRYIYTYTVTQLHNTHTNTDRDKDTDTDTNIHTDLDRHTDTHDTQTHAYHEVELTDSHASRHIKKGANILPSKHAQELRCG